MQLIDGIKPPRKITRQDAIARVIALEDMIHNLVKDCDVSGLTEAADILDRIIDAPLDAVYKAICEGN